MKQRAVMAVLLLALALQGPVSTYASTLWANGKVAGTTTCSVGDASLGDSGDCCSTGSASCCSAACLLSLTALPTDATHQIVPAYRIAIPERAAVIFVGHDSPRPLRPPIV